MSLLWESLGSVRVPMAISLVAVLTLAGWSAVKLLSPGAGPDLRTKAWIDGILFWGGFSMVVGVLGTLLGIILAAQAIESAGAVPASLVWGGIKVSTVSSAFGMLTLAFAGVLWYGLQLRWRLLSANEARTLA